MNMRVVDERYPDVYGRTNSNWRGSDACYPVAGCHYNHPGEERFIREDKGEKYVRSIR